VRGFLLVLVIPLVLIGVLAWGISRRQRRGTSMTPPHDQWKIERDAQAAAQPNDSRPGFDGVGGGAFGP